MSEALQALYAGEVEKARELLPADDELSVFDAAAFGRVERLRAILGEDPAAAAALSDDGFTALHLAVFGRQEEAARILIDARRRRGRALRRRDRPCPSARDSRVRP